MGGKRNFSLKVIPKQVGCGPGGRGGEGDGKCGPDSRPATGRKDRREPRREPLARAQPPPLRPASCPGGAGQALGAPWRPGRLAPGLSPVTWLDSARGRAAWCFRASVCRCPGPERDRALCAVTQHSGDPQPLLTATGLGVHGVPLSTGPGAGISRECLEAQGNLGSGPSATPQGKSKFSLA